MLDWAERILLNYRKENSVKIILILDRCTSHLSSKLKNLLERHNIEIIFIPSGATSILQPLDVSINKPFKDFFRKNFNIWLENFGLKEDNIGKTGNIKAAKKIDILEWTLKSFDSIPRCQIADSFKVNIFENHTK